MSNANRPILLIQYFKVITLNVRCEALSLSGTPS